MITSPTPRPVLSFCLCWGAGGAFSRCGRAGVGVPFLPSVPGCSASPPSLLQPLVAPGSVGCAPFCCSRRGGHSPALCASRAVSLLSAVPFSLSDCACSSYCPFQGVWGKQRCSTYHFNQTRIAAFIMCFGIHRAEPSCSVMSDLCDPVGCSPPHFAVRVSCNAGGFSTPEPPKKPEEFLDYGFLSK